MRRILIPLLFAAMLFGCARIPRPTGHEFSTQQKLEATEHWRELAAVTVKNLTLEPGIPVYITRDDRSPFGRSFASFLRHEVALKGVPVTTDKTNALVIDWGIDIIRHKAERVAPRAFPGHYTLLALLASGVGYYLSVNDPVPAIPLAAGLGLDLANAYVNGTPTPTNTEIIINITTAHNESQRQNYIAAYYINQKDSDHYWTRPAYWGRPPALAEHNYNVVNK